MFNVSLLAVFCPNGNPTIPIEFQLYIWNYKQNQKPITGKAARLGWGGGLLRAYFSINLLHCSLLFTLKVEFIPLINHNQRLLKVGSLHYQLC